MPFLTPDNEATVYAPFILYLPVDSTTGEFLIDYASIVAGALLELTYPANFEQYGTQTPEYAANVFHNAYDLTFPLQEC